MAILESKNLTVSIDKEIIKNLSLNVGAGSVHAVMGPNGSGKSTLAYTLLGHPSCKITDGNIIFDGMDITDCSVDKRSRLGLFLSFQSPYEIPGLQVFTYLKEIYSLHSQEDLSVEDFKNILKPMVEVLGLEDAFLWRNLNDGFSGGEKKRMEMLQLMVVQPRVAIIDEIDSGLDVDALKAVAKAVSYCQEKNKDMAIVLITHYQRILDYVLPDQVHILCDGKLVKSGSSSLAKEIEQFGYADYTSEKSSYPSIPPTGSIGTNGREN